MTPAIIQFLIEFLFTQNTTLQNIAGKIEKISPIDDDRTNSLAYFIHNYYSCAEDSIKEISKIFDGKSITKGESFHKELLLHAKFELLGIRPKVISNQSFTFLDEILRFRHVFRHAYNYVLNPTRVRENKTLILENHTQLLKEFNLFIVFLENIKIN